MKLSKFRTFIIVATLLAATTSYFVGVKGIDVAQAIVESRCSAGAFIAHSEKPSSVQADSHSDTAITQVTSAGHISSANYAPVTLAPANLITNPGLETFKGTRPVSWDSNSTGNNTAKFATVAGHNSKTAARIDVTKYTDGTADWFPLKLTPTPGAYYQYQDMYRSNVPSRAVLMIKDSTGKQQFTNLDSVAPSDQWTLYTQRFFVPTNAVEILVSHPLDRAGWLETDDYKLQLATQSGFSEGIVSLTFDDGWRSIHDTALPLMEQYNVVSTQYLVSGFLGRLKEYMKPGDVYDFTKRGHEVGSHTYDHPDLTKLDDKQLNKQVKQSKANLNKCYPGVSSFAPPFGASNEHTLSVVKPQYQTSRSTEAGYNSPDTFNPYQLKVQNVRADTSPQQMKAWIDTALANHVWLILVYHQVTERGGEYSRRPVDFQTDLLTLKDSGIDILTIHDAYQMAQNESIIQKH